MFKALWDVVERERGSYFFAEGSPYFLDVCPSIVGILSLVSTPTGRPGHYRELGAGHSIVLAARGGTPDIPKLASGHCSVPTTGACTLPAARGATASFRVSLKGAAEPDDDENKLSKAVSKLARRARTQYLPENEAQIECADVDDLAL